MNSTTKTITIAVVVAIVAFFAGRSYGARASTTATSAQTGAFAQGATGARTGAVGARAGGGFTGGQVVKVEQGDIVISTQAGGSQIVLVSTSTPVMKTTAGSLSDLSAGQTVQVTGTTNSDGSLSASSIQIRPETQK